MVLSRIYRHFYGSLLLMLCTGSFLIGCAGFRQMQLPPPRDNVPVAYELEGVPFFPQEQYQCGPAALAMALSFSGLALQPEDLAAEVYTPSRKGSLQMAMIGAARRHGRLAYEISGVDSIFQEIAAGHPVIILQNLGLSWFPVWHYAVVVGYDTGEEMVILRSGTDPRKLMPFAVFEKTWARSSYWGILVLKPDKLPAMATEKTYLASVIGLEKARQYEAAIIGYQTALKRWPLSLTAQIGLGNSYYAIGDLTNCEHAFRDAARLHPDAGSVYNNLAQVLLEQGRKHEALEAARKAVFIGGPLKTAYEKTLKEIEIHIDHKK